MNDTPRPDAHAAPPPRAQAPSGWARRRWPLILVGMLALHATLIVYAATLAVGDKSFAVVPDYYDKALNWDADRADQRAAAQRGWVFTLRPGAFADDAGQRLMVAELRDADGRALPGAQVELEFFHHAHAKRAARVALRETRPGRHEAVAPVGPGGAWRFNARVAIGDQRATFSRDVTVSGHASDPEAAS